MTRRIAIRDLETGKVAGPLNLENAPFSALDAATIMDAILRPEETPRLFEPADSREGATFAIYDLTASAPQAAPACSLAKLSMTGFQLYKDGSRFLTFLHPVPGTLSRS